MRYPPPVFSDPGWSVLCDFDGTIAREDVIDTLLERFGLPGWQVLERQWREGRIGSRECMGGQVALLDMSCDQLALHLRQCRIDPAFPGFARRLHALGIPLLIASDGLDRAIHAILDRHGLDDLAVAANHLHQVSARRWQLQAPFSAADCASGTCKCNCARSVAVNGRRTLLIGDGHSDFCAAAEVDFVFAKHRLIEHCEHRRIPYRAIRGFEDVMALLPRLLAGQFDDECQPLPAAAQS